MVQERSYTSDEIPRAHTSMIQKRCYELLESLFRCEFAVSAILRLNICTRLVSILQLTKLPPFGYKFNTDSTHLTVATALLARMTGWPGGVSAVAETAILDAIKWIECQPALHRALDDRDNITRYKDTNTKSQISE
ncbi:hypothetical protein C8R45DRAFT_1084188 [Mycena sanguinolenta]|nr:hypothetical protein C8R45DRAFT_1084188 [Mycena sanguinolenta]